MWSGGPKSAADICPRCVSCYKGCKKTARNFVLQPQSLIIASSITSSLSDTRYMSEQLVRIATRESPLALWQAEFIKAELEAAHPGIQVELLGMTTRGDQILDSPLAKIGGKGLFV